MVGISSETIHPLMQSNWVEMMSGARSHFLSPHALCHSGRDESSRQMMTVISQNNSRFIFLYKVEGESNPVKYLQRHNGDTRSLYCRG